MPKIAYIDKTFRDDKLELIGIANGIVAEYEAQGYGLTLRQLYYQMVSRDIIPNNIRSYKNLGNLINDARLAGLVDWHAIENRTRNLRRREEIARYCPGRAVKCMKGMAHEKLNALTHEYPSRMPWIERYGYDPKQLSHILRLDIMIDRYVAGAPYGECLDMSDHPELLRVKRDGDGMTAAEATETAQEACRRISSKADAFCEERGLRTDESVDALLDGILFEAVSRAFRKELGA